MDIHVYYIILLVIFTILQMYEDGEKEQNQLTEEVHFTRSENMTLKTLVIAKDSILIQKSQALENLKVWKHEHLFQFAFRTCVQHYVQNGEYKFNKWIER